MSSSRLQAHSWAISSQIATTAVRSVSVEGAYVFYADYADSDAVLVPGTGKGFVSRWHMG